MLRRSLWVWVAWGAFSSLAYANEGIFCDATTLLFLYDATNAGAKAGEVIGEISITDRFLSNSAVQKLDLGPNGIFGGGDDVVLDIARISGGDFFDAEFKGEIIKGALPNQYSIEGIWKRTDTLTTLAEPSIHGVVTAGKVVLENGVFSFGGVITPAPARDAVLVGIGPQWRYLGIPGDTAVAPDEDGVRGQVTLFDGRPFFDLGDFGEGHFAPDGVGLTLDQYLSTDRNSTSADIKINIIPEPASLALLGLGALGLLGRLRRSSLPL